MAFRPRPTVLISAAIAVLLAAAIGSAVLQGDDDDVDLLKGLPTTTTTAAPKAVAAGDLGDLAAVGTRLISGPHGLLVRTADGTGGLRQVSDRPMQAAYGVGGGRIVAQHDDGSRSSRGPIVLIAGDGEHELVGAAPAGGYATLHDGAVVDGRSLAVVTTGGGTGPDDWEEHLLLVDLDTGKQTDLGRPGGWEEGVTSARLLPDGSVALIHVVQAGAYLEHWSDAGRPDWQVDLGDAAPSLVLRGDDAIVLDPGYEGLAATLTWRAFAAATGTAGDHAKVALRPERGLAVGAAFCSHAEDGGKGDVLCDQSEGPTLRITLADGRTVREPGSPEIGTMSTWRDAP